MKRQNQIPQKNRFSELPLLRRGLGGGLLFFIFLFNSNSAGAQEKDWQWIKRGGANIEGNEVERVYDIATDSDRNVYVVSPIGVHYLDVDGHPETFYGNPGESNSDYVLASFSCDGSYRWSKVIGGSNLEMPFYIETDHNNNLYVAGRFSSCDPDEQGDYPSRFGDDIVLDQSPDSCSLLFIAKFDQNGNMLWFDRPQEETSLPVAYSQTGAWGLASDPNGNAYWLVTIPPGTYADGSFVNTMDGSNWFVFKYSPNGEFLDATYIDLQLSPGVAGLSLKMYRNPYNDHFYFTGNRDTNGSAVIGGETVTGGLYIACFDPQGAFQWMRENTFTNSTGGSKIYGLDFDAQNNIYLGGCMIGDTDIGQDTFLGYSIDEFVIPGFVMKTGPTAQGHLWASNNNNSGSGKGAISLEDNILSYADKGAGPDFTWNGQVIDINNFEGSEVLLAQFDKTTGDCVNLDFIQGDPGYQDYGTALAIDANNDILVGGQFQHLLYDANGNTVINENTTATDFFIAKYAAVPCGEMAVEEALKTSIEIYPNPVSGNLFVSVKGETNYRLYDLLGKLIQKGSINETHNSIGTEKLPKGLYVLELEDGEGKVETVKVVVE